MAQSTFDSTSERMPITWNVLISAYVQCGLMKATLGSFVTMCWEGFEPAETTFVCALSTCDCEEQQKMASRCTLSSVKANVKAILCVGTSTWAIARIVWWARALIGKAIIKVQSWLEEKRGSVSKKRSPGRVEKSASAAYIVGVEERCSVDQSSNESTTLLFLLYTVSYVLCADAFFRVPDCSQCALYLYREELLFWPCRVCFSDGKRCYISQ